MINGLNAEQKANLVRQALIVLHEHNINIISITFDEAPVNLTMCTILGCNLNVMSFQTYFFHPTTNEKIVVFFDPCHCVKLLRNCLGEHKSLIDDNGNLIQCEYFIKLNNIQIKEGLHLPNKLRMRHIEYHKQKMKVKLTTQIFSASVANALEICRTDLKDPDFANSAPTIKFIRLVNDLFDIFNSISMKQMGFKQPLHKNNNLKVYQKLEEGYIYFSQLQIMKKKKKLLLIHSRNKAAPIGFMMCIKSIIVLFDNLIVDRNVLQYLPCYKFSQDHIELLFGCIRAHGGCNNNPTARQFKAAYKKILIHSEIRETGNCIPLEAISILHVSTNSEVVINQSTPRSRVIDDNNNQDSNEDLPFLPDTITFEFSTRVIAFIAGFVVRHLRKVLRCEICIEALTGNETHIQCSLINIKNCGGLTFPSHDVIIICTKAETIIRMTLRECGGKRLSKNMTESFLLNQVLQHLVGNTHLFCDLEEHSHDQTILGNHVFHLIKAIAPKYIKTRLYFIGRSIIDNNIVSVRQAFNKIVLFKG